jgi:SSS family transporter
MGGLLKMAEFVALLLRKKWQCEAISGSREAKSETRGAGFSAMSEMAAFDYIVLIGYMLLVIGLGVYASRKNDDAADLLLAGRSANWLAVAASMYASFFSSISFLAMPAETFRHDWQYATGMLMMPVAAVVAGYVFVEFFYRLRLFTVYQYAEMRFSNSVRLLLVAMFVFGKSLHAGLVVYGGSLALSIATGIPLTIVIVAVGATAIIYTSVGGLQAVIWTDVLQLFVLTTAIVVTLFAAVGALDGGFSDVIRVGAESGKFNLMGDQFSMTARLTLPGVMLGAFAAWMSQKGVDQVNAQLYLAGRSARQARHSLLLAPVISITVGCLLYFLGTAFWVYYQQHPDPNVEQFVANGEQDRILPYFVINTLPVGFRGLVVAGLFAAAMSTLDSLLNALATTSLVDFYRPFIRPALSSTEETWVARGFMLGWGAVITGFAAWVIPMLGESMIDISNRIVGFAGGPVLGVFLLGMFSKRANAFGVMCGALGSFAVLIGLYVAGELRDDLRVSFTLYAAIGIAVSVGLGYVASLFGPATSAKSEGLLWRDIVWQAWQQEAASEASGAASPRSTASDLISTRN